MGLRLKKKDDGTVHPSDMKDGDVGVITSSIGNTYIGCAVQKINKALQLLGSTHSSNWTEANGMSSQFRVRILKPGDTLEVTG